MKRTSLLVPAAIIVVANAFALLHAMRNRAGVPDAEITLTQRELRYSNSSSADDDSGVTLYLQWTDPSVLWLDRSKLQELGFPSSVDPNSPDAGPYYRRQRPRKVFLALEYDGSAWRAWQEVHERGVASGPRPSHLLAIDADLDPLKLRARHPDRTTVIILPAVLAVTLETYPSPRVVGRIQQLPTSIHVPRPFSDPFRAAGKKDLSYRIRLRYGASLEPWIIGIEFASPQNQ